MSSVFTGKRIVVTGGAGGIGVTTVRAFTQQGGMSSLPISTKPRSNVPNPC
jgi:FlaA1/EpsC-like NDP-sugar epimerase